MVNIGGDVQLQFANAYFWIGFHSEVMFVVHEKCTKRAPMLLCFRAVSEGAIKPARRGR